MKESEKNILFLNIYVYKNAEIIIQKFCITTWIFTFSFNFKDTVKRLFITIHLY